MTRRSASRISWFFSGILAIASLTAGTAALAQPHDTAPSQGHAPSIPGHHAAAAAGQGSVSGEHVEEAEGEGEEHGIPDFNFADFSNKKTPPYLAALINFGLLIFLYVRLGRKPIAEALKNRRAKVAKEIDDATRILKEAEGRAKKYQAKLDALDDDVAGTKKSLADAGDAEKARITHEAEEKAVRMEKDARFLLEQETRQARLDLVRETVEEAILAAEDLLKKRVTMADQERLAEDYLRELASRGPGSRSFAPAAPGGAPSGPPSGPPPGPPSAVKPSTPPQAVTGGDS